jgi:nitrogen fixation protein FixH
MSSPTSPDFRLTGRMVLIGLVAFFAIVVGVNAIMIRAATSTFGGVETANAYQAGLAFNRQQAGALAQDALHWNVTADLTRRADGAAALVVNVRDNTGVPLAALDVDARLLHPADARRDHHVSLRELTAGRFEGSEPVPAGLWDLVIDISRRGAELFRSKSRIVLR